MKLYPCTDCGAYEPREELVLDDASLPRCAACARGRHAEARRRTADDTSRRLAEDD